MVRFTSQGHKRRYELQKESVLRYFSDPKKWDIVYDYLQGEGFSKRFLDHLVTDYARTNNCQYVVEEEDGETRLFNIYHSAQTLLSGVHKKHMDPFKRQNELLEDKGFFRFGHDPERIAVTSVCQLTFYRWAIRNDVLKFAREHEKAIKEDMAAISQKKKRLKQEQPITGISIDLKRKDRGEDQEENDDDDSEDEMIKETNTKASQQPRKRRKRYRENRVNTLFNNAVSVKVVFSK